MLEKETMVSVTNRDVGSISYTIPDLGIKRRFESGETKDLSVEELIKLSYIDGGQVLLEDHLMINDPEIARELLPEVEPEYFYTKEEVKRLLEEGSLAQLEDCLDFAPEGTINLVKDVAVEIELNDISKRKAILDKTGFNVTSAININILSKTDNEEPESTRKRRADAFVSKKEATTSKRRTAPVTESKYKIIKKG